MFIFQEPKSSSPPNKYPTITLTRIIWDDYGTICTFFLIYHKKKGDSKDIGEIKILQNEKKRTELPISFSKLDERFISLGQSLDFYKNLIDSAGFQRTKKILTALNEISWNPRKGEQFESLHEYRNALFRENSAHIAFRFGKSIVLNQHYNESFSFNYEVNIDGSDNPFDIHVDFNEHDKLPGRIVGIIGKNAVGKTQLMAMLAKDLVQVGRISQESVTKKDDRFYGQRPIFNRVIAVSYSAFDKFIRPKNPQGSYVYCGIRNEKGALSRAGLISNYLNNLKLIKKLNREDDWISFMSEILDDESKEFHRNLENELLNIDKADGKSLSTLSSGQSILAHFVTAIVARMQTHTLMLFDEPETHLHPNAVAHLFNVLNRMLKMYKSYAIIATHSPIVIQEIPRKRVILLNRNKNSTFVSDMDFETFGESISELTRHVFDTATIPNYYKETLRKLSKSTSASEVNKLFDDGLGFNAKAYLLAQYGNKK